MRIARVLTRLNLGGPARQVLASDPLLVARGHVVRVFAGSPERGEGDLGEELSARGVEVRRVPGLRRGLGALLDGGDLRATRFLRRELAAFAPDVVHTHASKAGALGRRAARAAAPSAPRVHTFHGHVLEGYFPAPVSVLMRAAERRLARGTAQLLAVSEATRSDLVRLGVVPAARIELRPPGIELDRLLALPEERPTGPLRRELSIPPGAPIVAVIGRLAPVKRPALAVEVFARAEQIERCGAHLLFAGDGGERRAVERAVDRLPAELGARVHLLGAVAGIERVHEAADVLLATSRSEGMPVAMIEAAAAARPVVTTAVGGVPELVTSGLTGLFGTDRDALAVALAGLLADPEERTRLGRAARIRAAELHGAEALADGLEGVYRRLLASRP